MNKLALGLCVALFALQTGLASACTTILVTKGASADGSMIVTHSEDNELGDQRLVYVPAMDHPDGAMRPVFPCSTNYPRVVTGEFGPGYDTPGLPPTVPLGHIPQVSHTYAYFNGNYGIMNEHQLAIGECTDAAQKYEGKPEAGKRLFSSQSLARVALERCTKAREAVELMGGLIDRYGFYGQGETLTVVDIDEGWVMEMCSAPDGASLWVARKVPDGGVFAAANEFRIREVDPQDPDMVFSGHLFDVVEENGWWKPEDGKLDWLKAVSYGEYNHPYYSLRRVWSIMRRVKPSAEFSPWVKDGYTREYPFSVQPDRKLTVEDVMALHRDYYNGTQFDMRKGMAAGPFGNPVRYYDYKDYDSDRTDLEGAAIWGAWERPISVYYTGFSFVCQARGWIPDPVGGVCWFGPDEAYTTCYTPFYAGITRLPSSYSTGSTAEFTRETAFWAFDFVSNWSAVKYSYIIKDIQKKQGELESREFAMQGAVEDAALKLYGRDPDLAREYLTDYCVGNAEKVVAAWWAMANDLIEKYSDGYINRPTVAMEAGYPRWWLEEVGYTDGPTTYGKKGGF